MTEDLVPPDVNEILRSALHDLRHADGVLSKAASRLQSNRRLDVPSRGPQAQALTVVPEAIDNARAAIRRARDALTAALGTDDPPS